MKIWPQCYTKEHKDPLIKSFVGGQGARSQLAIGSWQKKKRGNEEEKKKENGTNGKYPYEAWYDD
ncbi:MAG: hypothetical protein GTO45_24155 [Candidatus Aminicenantes bacterium]|nr:hypothetical protein [Candidatus Aminicenantes bacterium]NIM81846.1 hypothetical protein [Candidatus Aminicenantes bacterium]NIN21220.1 hypothetical protein [Candidatus Aminicenantes bacterium]NIN45044.1 hypothetical protein [Candidatus Aminicenantes bacterium]NIN87861.1 hypothetical protein [Candidatus Aminicenantes bacterium]